MRSESSRSGSSVIVFAALMALMIGSAGVRAEGDSPSRKRFPLVAVKQERIQGSVYVIADESREESSAADLRVVVQTLDGTKVLAETTTDKDGNFELKSLDEGRYELQVGRLVLELSVEPPVQAGEGQTDRQAKRLLVFMPYHLVEKNR